MNANMKMNLIIILSICFMTFQTILSFSQNNNTFTDNRDSQEYSFVKIGQTFWMSTNLNFKVEDSWCYKDNQSMCKKYGRIYNWYSAQKVCPSGWKLPSKDDWERLFEQYGGIGRSSFVTMTKYDNFNFKIQFGGNRYQGHDRLFFYGFLEELATFWTSTEDRSYFDSDISNDYQAFSVLISTSNEVTEIHSGSKFGGTYIRCIRK